MGVGGRTQCLLQIGNDLLLKQLEGGQPCQVKLEMVRKLSWCHAKQPEDLVFLRVGLARRHLVVAANLLLVLGDAAEETVELRLGGLLDGAEQVELGVYVALIVVAVALSFHLQKWPRFIFGCRLACLGLYSADVAQSSKW